MAKVKFLKGTQAQYDAIVEKDPTTFYRLTDTKKVYYGDIDLTSSGEIDDDLSLDDFLRKDGTLKFLAEEIEVEGVGYEIAKEDMKRIVDELIKSDSYDYTEDYKNDDDVYMYTYYSWYDSTPNKYNVYEILINTDTEVFSVKSKLYNGKECDVYVSDSGSFLYGDMWFLTESSDSSEYMPEGFIHGYEE